MTVGAKKRGARERPAVPPHLRDREVVSGAAAAEERTATLALIDELAVLAAELWFAGRLDGCLVQEEAGDDDGD